MQDGNDLGRLDQLIKLLHACRGDGTATIMGATFVLQDGRLWVRFRGDLVGNWRESGAHLVFENALGELSISRSVEVALNVTMGELAAHLPDDMLSGITDRDQ
jgi:hypothetical protein